MGLFFRFIALGCFGGSIIKDKINTNKDDRLYNKSHKESRIYQRNGKYYDSVTGKRVISHYIKDPVSGETSKIWKDLYDHNQEHIIYNEGRERWNNENNKWKQMIEEARSIKNPIYLQEAEEQNLRFAKCVLPYFDGARIIAEGYIDRLEKINPGKERKYYFAERYHNWKYCMRSIHVGPNKMWTKKDGFLCYKPLGGTFAYLDDKYMEE